MANNIPEAIKRLAPEFQELYVALNDSFGKKIDNLETKFSSRIDNLCNRMNNLERDMQIHNAELRTEIYKVEARSFNRGFTQFDSPFKVEASLPSLGNSATNPDYDLFRDEEYDL